MARTTLGGSRRSFGAKAPAGAILCDRCIFPELFDDGESSWDESALQRAREPPPQGDEREDLDMASRASSNLDVACLLVCTVQ